MSKIIFERPQNLLRQSASLENLCTGELGSSDFDVTVRSSLRQQEQSAPELEKSHCTSTQSFDTVRSLIGTTKELMAMLEVGQGAPQSMLLNDTSLVRELYELASKLRSFAAYLEAPSLQNHFHIPAATTVQQAPATSVTRPANPRNKLTRLQDIVSSDAGLVELRLVPAASKVTLVSPLLVRSQFIDFLVRHGWMFSTYCAYLIIVVGPVALSEFVLLEEAYVRISDERIMIKYTPAILHCIWSVIVLGALFIYAHLIQRALFFQVLLTFDAVVILSQLVVACLAQYYNLYVILGKNGKLDTMMAVGICLRVVATTIGIIMMVAGSESSIMPRFIKLLLWSIALLVTTVYYVLFRASDAFVSDEICFWMACTTIKTVTLTSLCNGMVFLLSAFVGMMRGQEFVLIRGHFKLQRDEETISCGF